MYTIIDVETTGQTNRITEISIFKYDGTSVIDEFTSLVNPIDYIPPNITALTGIDNGMVADAPLFEEISSAILAITKDSIFVAHNVNFDYRIIAGEFKRLGIDFQRKKLCTVQLSRKLFPGFKSYSLGKLCVSLDVRIADRHRARGDAEATVIIFEKLLAQKNASEVFEAFIKKDTTESFLPDHLPKTLFDSLPSAHGIYYFRNQEQKILYIGKSKDIKKTVLRHFKNKKEKALCSETTTIDFELSGSELLALLMQEAAVNRYLPAYNAVLKRNPKSFAIFSYTDRGGIMHLAYKTSKGVPSPHLILYSIRECNTFLERICKKFELRAQFCNLQEPAFSSLPLQRGICSGKEATEAYNRRVSLAIDFISSSTKDAVIKEKGRTPNEDSFVLIKDNRYLGYGFIDRHETIASSQDLENYLITQKDSTNIQKILRQRLLALQ